MESSRRSCARCFFLPGSFHIALTGVLLAFCLVLPAAAGEATDGGAAAAAAGDDHGSPLSIVWKWGNFILLFGGLAYYLRRPLREFLQTRAQGIEEGLASGRRAQEEAAAKMSSIEARLARLDEEIDGLKRQATRESRRGEASNHRQLPCRGRKDRGRGQAGDRGVAAFGANGAQGSRGPAGGRSGGGTAAKGSGTEPGPANYFQVRSVAEGRPVLTGVG